MGLHCVSTCFFFVLLTVTSNLRDLFGLTWLNGILMGFFIFFVLWKIHFSSVGVQFLSVLLNFTELIGFDRVGLDFIGYTWCDFIFPDIIRFHWALKFSTSTFTLIGSMTSHREENTFHAGYHGSQTTVK